MSEHEIADKIGNAARRSRSPDDSINYNISDKVDQMVLLHEILVELRKIRTAMEDEE